MYTHKREGFDVEKKDYNKHRTERKREMWDRIALEIPKGSKENLQSHAAQRGESLNSFIRRAIERQIEEDEAKQ